MHSIQGVIFDLDGTLVDSESLWPIAYQETMESFDLEPDTGITTIGMRLDEALALRNMHVRHSDLDMDVVMEAYVTNMIDLFKNEGSLMPGVKEILRFFSSRNIPMSIASSAPGEFLEAVVEHCDIGDHMQFIHTAFDDEYGKPHPSVYMRTAAQMGIAPHNILVFEDSINGLIAAKAAQMRCVIVPYPEAIEHDDPRLGIADTVLMSLEEFDIHTFSSLTQQS